MANRSFFAFLGGVSVAGAFGAYRLRSDIENSNSSITDRISVIQLDILRVADKLTRRVETLETGIENIISQAASKNDVEQQLYKMQLRLDAMETELIAFRAQQQSKNRADTILDKPTAEIVDKILPK